MEIDYTHAIAIIIGASVSGPLTALLGYILARQKNNYDKGLSHLEVSLKLIQLQWKKMHEWIKDIEDWRSNGENLTAIIDTWKKSRDDSKSSIHDSLDEIYFDIFDSIDRAELFGSIELLEEIKKKCEALYQEYEDTADEIVELNTNQADLELMKYVESWSKRVGPLYKKVKYEIIGAKKSLDGAYIP